VSGVASTERTRTFTWSDPLRSARTGLQLPGLDYIRAVADGELPAPPVARMLGMEIVEVERGRAVFALEPAEWMYNPIGSVHGGIAATVLDSCMGCAVHTTLDPGVGYATSDLHVRYVRAMREDSGRVLAEGRVVHEGSRVATAEGRLVLESGGALIAHATTGCSVFPTADPKRSNGSRDAS